MYIYIYICYLEKLNIVLYITALDNFKLFECIRTNLTGEIIINTDSD